MSHEIVDWDEDESEEKMSSDEPEKTMGGVVLKLGDIIETFAPSNAEYHEKTFYINYIDDHIIEILDVTSGFKHTLTMYDSGQLTEETITQIHLLSRAPEEGYARQNGLTTGVWINVHFGGEIPTVITGEITNVDEDMIEIMTYPDMEVIYLNFEYRGIPKNLPIEKIEIREMPKSVEGSLRQMVESSESGPADFGEFASMNVSETGEIAIIMPDKPRMDPNFNDTLKELILNVDEIIFGEEEEIEVRTEVKRSEQRYGIDIQLNDLLDELLSTIPTHKQTSRVMARIHTIVRRFKELREKFSTFDDNGNVTGYNNFDAAYKPLAEHLEKMDRNLRWILPVVKQQTKLYNVEEGFVSDHVSNKSYITDVLEMKSKKNLYKEYSAYYENMNENMTPFEQQNGGQAVQAVHADLDAIVENLDNYYSHVYNKVNKSYQVGTRRFVMQKYNLGLSKMHQHIMKSGKTVYLRGSMTLPDRVQAKSVIMLPDAVVDFSRVDLPGTSVLDRVNKSHNWLYYYRLLRGKTEVQTISANEKIEDVPGFLEFVTDFETDGTMTYNEILKNVIPRSRSIIAMMRDRISDPYSFYSIISFFEPFLLYPDNITYSAKTLSDKRSNIEITHGGSYQEIRYFVKEMVKKYKAIMATKGAEFGTMGSKKYEKEGSIQESIYRVLKENSEFLKMVKERYPATPEASTGSSEILNILLNVDGGSAYMATVSLMMGVLFKPDLSRILASDGDAIEASILKTKSCATRSIAKQYKSVRDMQKDNDTEDVYFDKEYDDTPYAIMEKYEEEKGKMLPERFVEYLKMVLVEKHDANADTAEELAANLIAGRRKIREGNYAMLSIVPVAPNKDSIAGIDVTIEENARKKTSFYVRHKNTWVREDVDEETFCNLSRKCYPGEENKKKTCDSEKYTQERLKQKDLANARHLDIAIDLTTQDMTEELKARAKYHIDLLKKIRWIKDSAAKQQNIFFYMMGTQVAENTIVESPYTKLRDYILGQSDFPKRHADIMRFRDHFCRDAIVSDTVVESEHWLYCVDTNSKLLPKFLYELAYSYIVSNNYEDELDRVCRHNGKLSEDHDAIVDKHSGYVIKQIDFVDEDEYNEAGFKVSHADIMTASAGESLLSAVGDADISHVFGRKTKTGKKIFEDIHTQHIYNIANSLCEYMGVDFDIIEERIMLLSIEFVKNLDSAEIYKAKQEKAAKKNIKIVSYQTYYDQNKLYFTACVTFVAIQTAIPSFTPRKTFPGCIFSFGGYPLEAGEENNVGIKYLACVIENVKSSVEPWNSIGNQKREVITQRLMELMSKRVMLNSDVADLYLRKKQHMDENPDAYAIPKEHDVSKWTQFQPPIVKIGLQGVQTQAALSSEFKEELGLALKKGDKLQQDMLGTVYAKIIANSYGVIENVNTIVAIFGKEALLRAGSIVFLENACCEDEAKSFNRKALDFFIDKDPNILKSIEIVKSYSEIYNDAKKLARPSYLFNPMESKKIIDVEKKISEEQIYEAFIHYCKLTTDAPVPDDLRAYYPDKPHLETKDLPQMIEKLKGMGHKHSQKSLQDLMQTVAHRNIVSVDLQEKKADYGIDAFVDLVEHLSSENIIEAPLAGHIMKLVELYKGSAGPDGSTNLKNSVLPSSKVDALNALKRYLMKANRFMLDVINKYIVEFSSMKARDKSRISSFLTNIGSWTSNASDAELMYKSSQFIKNCVHATTKEVPSMLLNSSTSMIGNINSSAMKHWDLSEIHERNIYRNVSDYYGKLNVYQKDEMVCKFFMDMEVMLVNLNLFAEHIPVFADQQLLFDRETVQMLYIYIYYSVFHDLIVESNDEEYVKIEMANVKQMRRNMSMTAEEIELEAIFGAEDDEDEDENVIGDEYNILVGKQQDFKKRICQLFTILIEMDMNNKSIIDINYKELSDKIYKANQAEKKTITDRFEKMSIEERSVENAMKNYKIGAWNAGEEKGLFIYDKRTYNKEVSGQMMANVAVEGADVAELNAFDEANADADADREAYDISNLGENYEDGAYYEEDMERDE